MPLPGLVRLLSAAGPRSSSRPSKSGRATEWSSRPARPSPSTAGSSGARRWSTSGASGGPTGRPARRRATPCWPARSCSRANWSSTVELRRRGHSAPRRSAGPWSPRRARTRVPRPRPATPRRSPSVPSARPWRRPASASWSATSTPSARSSAPITRPGRAWASRSPSCATWPLCARRGVVVRDPVGLRSARPGRPGRARRPPGDLARVGLEVSGVQSRDVEAEILRYAASAFIHLDDPRVRGSAGRLPVASDPPARPCRRSTCTAASRSATGAAGAGPRADAGPEDGGRARWSRSTARRSASSRSARDAP